MLGTADSHGGGHDCIGHSFAAPMLRRMNARRSLRCVACILGCAPLVDHSSALRCAAGTPMFLMSRKIRAMGVKMVLSGEGADEAFGGYTRAHAHTRTHTPTCTHSRAQTRARTRAASVLSDGTDARQRQCSGVL